MSIPRYILIETEGRIVSSNVSKLSDSKLHEYFDTLK